MRSGKTTSPSTTRVRSSSMNASSPVASGKIMRSALECEMSRSCHKVTFSSAVTRVAADHAREPAHALGDDRVPLVRHRAGALLPLGERLLDLAHLGASQVADLGGDRVERRRGDRERRHVLRVTVALDHLGAHLGGRQAEPGADELLDAGIHRAVGAHDTAEGAYAHRLACPSQPVAVAVELEGPHRELVTERGGLGVHPVAATDDRRLPVHERGVASPRRGGLRVDRAARRRPRAAAARTPCRARRST